MSPFIEPRQITNKHRLIDVRTPREFSFAFIEGAENIPLAELKERFQGLEGQENLVLVCASGTRAKSAQKILKERGISCCLLEGGLNAWAKAGLPLQKRASSAGLSIERQVRLIAGGLAAIGGGLAVAIDPLFSFVPIAVGLGLVHAGLTDQCLMALILNKLPYNQARPTCSCSTASAGEK